MNANAKPAFRRGRWHSHIAVLLLSVFSLASMVQGLPGPPQSEVAPPPVTQDSWTPDALDELLAPIALYPDQLLGQILAASVNSQEVMDAGSWLLENDKLEGKALDEAATKAGFGPAMRALMQYPTTVDMMCQQMDWTRQVGAAFSSDQESVLDSVQRLRKAAADIGNLKTTPQQVVSTTKEGGNVYIEVKPADPTIVYVPQYDPQVVYTTPPPAAPAEETKKSDDGNAGTAIAAGLIGFAAGVVVGSAVHNDYYYPHWGVGVYYGPRPFYPAAYVYRPVYGPAFRPAYRYVPPPNYRYNYKNVRVNNNVVINNNNYYNRFNNNQNLRAGATRSPITSSPRNAQPTRAGQTAGTRANPARANSTARNTRSPNPSRVDRGYGDSARTTTPQGITGSQAQSRQPTTNRSVQNKESAFSGAGTRGGGSFQRSASTRGNASLGGRPASGSHGRRR